MVNDDDENEQESETKEDIANVNALEVDCKGQRVKAK